ncbi:flagellar biosynthesis protein [uncultured Roseibium sp.]|uniref:flagellar biosynthesis protein n=1 Tax=uncultured Roseibium sp. TaxID=1936171 RepID=UPI00259A0C9E|nr:flagellar biosynthesis protein [uncultured Roseibium sp.]
MPKTGNYVQRDYNSSSTRKSTWSDYNESWKEKRAAAKERASQLRTIANNFTTINTQATQAATSLTFQNQGAAGPYASTTTVMSRINMLI